MEFEWNEEKNQINKEKHGINFYEAKFAFKDKKRIILEDIGHSESERRFYCLGKTSKGILTVRFTMRQSSIRIIGAGYWRKGKKTYEEENDI